jgi:murein DD-endopeptidase MepM/ murein hydrolase activator NlpD
MRVAPNGATDRSDLTLFAAALLIIGLLLAMLHYATVFVSREFAGVLRAPDVASAALGDVPPPHAADGPSAAAMPAPLPTGPFVGAIGELRSRQLTLPVQDVLPESLVASFDSMRGTRKHEALDILAARGTPVLAVEDGTIERLFWSTAGGHAIYQFDPTRRYCYYYAHLDRYRDNLEQGQRVQRGQVLGYVGFTGNANPSAPHLHFAIFELTSEKQWWKGTPLDPYQVLR